MVGAGSATSLALIITELCQNAVEHGLANSSGLVEVRPTRQGQALQIEVLDDGLGLPADFTPSGASLGLSIVATLASDLSGTVEFSNRDPGPGTSAKLVIPLAVAQA